MYLINKTSKKIILAEVLGGNNDLVIPPMGKSEEFVPNKAALNKILINSDDLEVHVTSGTEINAIDEINPRLTTLLILD